MSYAIRVGDALGELVLMDAGSVQTCITSPPYFGLRDYGTGEWGGGDPMCDHVPRTAARATRPSSGLTGGKATVDAGTVHRDRCPCGATRVDQQLGLEATPDEYVARLVAVFREVRRVLRDDGTLWLNLGDSYNAYNGGAGPGSKLSKIQTEARPKLSTGYGLQVKALKPKDLLMIPARVALALQADGWTLRSEIVWSKPNPMPESVTDRPTKAHEQVFLLSKSPRYYYDADAIAESALQPEGPPRLTGLQVAANGGSQRVVMGGESGTLGTNQGPSTRNKRSVWTVATQPYPEAHFATFPPKLIEPMVLAGCPRRGIVLDPFAGSGTTLQVAVAHGRSAIGIELNPAYAALAHRRLEGVTPSMFDLEPAA